MSLVQWSTCRHCGHRFRNPAFELLITEEDRASSIGQFGIQLARHLAERHPQIEQQSQIAALKFAGMMRMVQFEHQSETVNETAVELLDDVEQSIPKIREMIAAKKNLIETPDRGELKQ